MTITPEKLRQLLVPPGYVSEADFTAALSEAKDKNRDVEEVLIDKDLIKDEQLGEVIAEASGWTFMNLSQERIDDDIVRLIPELVGRMPVVATLAELSEDALVQILTEPKNALVKQYSKLLAMEGVDLEIRPSALKAIAKKALARKTGARGLRSILEQSLIDTMFDLPNTANVDKVVVDESTIDENKPPLLVYREVAKKA